ncbi:hypothetical protein EYR40_009416 [Pleurotus pulmonarius]|nr:hypothetical protein EYR36_005209 [Pleurotus pulmonarius]KAF4590185.1 hypothetical protein EYR38_009483 [Pleurotus pulmonarius]KAF4590819.1 hypothetical protein EYR40_009416 [Pleurotus pulmonarius]
MASGLPNGGKWPMGKKDTKLAEDAAKFQWFRFMEVDKYVASGHKLYRASAPNYKGKDEDQEMTVQRAAFLKKVGIDCLISFNHVKYSSKEEGYLKAAGITYLWLQVPDFQPSTEKQVDDAYRMYKKHKATLVHCGFGWGRTGTAICALQLFCEKGANPPEKLWGEVDGGDQVETKEQIAMLADLKKKLIAGSIKN